MSLTRPADSEVLATAAADCVRGRLRPQGAQRERLLLGPRPPLDRRRGAGRDRQRGCSDPLPGPGPGRGARRPGPLFRAAHRADHGRAAARPAAAEIFEAAWEAECNSRLGYLLGPGYRPGEPPLPADELLDQPPGRPLAGPDGVEVLVVIPFQDRSQDRSRLRNLLACLLSLRDQSCARDATR